MSRSILGLPTFRELCNPLHQGEEQLDSELSLRKPEAVPFLDFATCWSGGGKEENCRGEEGGMNRSSITGRIIFHILFML